jgi:hypothetical protein
MYLEDPCFVKISKNDEEHKYAKRIENAAPIVPYIGTKTKKETKNIAICIRPLNISILDLPKLFSFDIMFIVIEEGMIAIASTNNTATADSYSGPIKERMEFGTTSRATTTGAVKLRLILRLPTDKSFCKADDAGITMYAMLAAKLATTIVIIKAI